MNAITSAKEKLEVYERMLSAIENYEHYYMHPALTEEGDYILDKDGERVWEDDDGEESRLSVIREVKKDFLKWALK